MKMKWTAALVTIVPVLISGCATVGSMELAAGKPFGIESEPAQVQERMLIWRASLSLEVSSVSNAVVTVGCIVRQSGGYVEDKSDLGEEHSHITLRIPADSLPATMDSLEAIGKVTRRNISSRDVTEQYVDTDARLRTMIALRDRLRELLDKAVDVKDILAIEKELGRVQADIDAMQARQKSLKGKVDLASVDVSIDRRKILGPIGYVWNKAWWLVDKLFVIQE